MPTITRYRTWCTHCNDWELFNSKNECLECTNDLVSVKLKDIPKEKLTEQRERYISYQKRNFQKMLFGFMAISESSFFCEGPQISIIENDAGQKKIDDWEKQKRKEERLKREEEYKMFLEKKSKYSKLGRNEKCLCGSGYKYKKCCYKKYG